MGVVSTWMGDRLGTPRAVGNSLRWAVHVARMEEGRSAFKILAGKPTGKITLGRPRSRWEDNIRMDLEEIGINAGNWLDSAQDRDYWKTLEYDFEPQDSICHGVS